MIAAAIIGAHSRFALWVNCVLHLFGVKANAERMIASAIKNNTTFIFHPLLNQKTSEQEW